MWHVDKNKEPGRGGFQNRDVSEVDEAILRQMKVLFSFRAYGPALLSKEEKWNLFSKLR